MSKEPSYIPPFTVSAEAINLIAEISGQIERYAIRLEQEDGPFIDYMLNEIYKTLKEHQGEPLPDKLHDKVPNKVPNKIPNKLRQQYPDLSDAVWDVYMELKDDAYASAETVGSRLGISGRMVRKHISVLREAGIIERIGGNKTGYWKILKKY